MTVSPLLSVTVNTWFSSPCLGIFFYKNQRCRMIKRASKFSSPCLGIFFYKHCAYTIDNGLVRFSSPCLGIFFYNHLLWETLREALPVFVPMFGDLFLLSNCFCMLAISAEGFSSPCLGIFFYMRYPIKGCQNSHLFSSPCLGIFFYAKIEKRDGKLFLIVFVPMFGDLFL